MVLVSQRFGPAEPHVDNRNMQLLSHHDRDSCADDLVRLYLSHSKPLNRLE